MGSHVYKGHLNRANGIFAFHWVDKVVLASSAAIGIVLGVIVKQFILSAVVTYLVMGSVFVPVLLWVMRHRKKDNHRFNHLEILFRSKKPPRWNFCERSSWVAFEHGSENRVSK